MSRESIFSAFVVEVQFPILTAITSFAGSLALNHSHDMCAKMCRGIGVNLHVKVLHPKHLRAHRHSRVQLPMASPCRAQYLKPIWSQEVIVLQSKNTKLINSIWPGLFIPSRHSSSTPPCFSSKKEVSCRSRENLAVRLAWWPPAA